MIRIDLLPDPLGGAEGGDDGPGRRRRRPDPWSIAILVAAFVIPPGTAIRWWDQRSETAALRQRLEAASADSARLAELRAASDSLAARSRQLQERAALVEELDRNRFVWPRLLDEISWALPRLAWLVSLRQLSPPPAGEIELQGIAASPLAVTRFARNLDASDYIADVRLLGSQKQMGPSGGASRHAFTLIVGFGGSRPSGRAEPLPPPEGG